MKLRRIIAMISLIALSLVTFAVPAFAAETTETAGDSWFKLSNILPVAILIVLVIAAVIFFFVIPKRREKTLKFFRGLKSECKKVSWYSWSHKRFRRCCNYRGRYCDRGRSARRWIYSGT